IPHVSIRNAYRTQYSRYHVADFEESIVSKVMKNPMRAQQALLRAASVPFMLKFNRILRRQGVNERMTYDRYMHSDALVAMCDVPEFAPVDDAPASFRYMGPLIWRSREPAPDWIGELPKGRKALYISLGSTGTPELFDVLAAQLARRDRPLIITTGYQIDRDAFPSRPGIYVEDMVNADEVFDRCAVVICHGGNGTVYQALSHGLVCIGIPTHLEQRYNCRRLVDMGLGGHLELDELKADPAKLAGLVDRLLGDGDVRARLCKFRSELASWDAPSLTADCIEELVG
ncbi:glycosyltransferase, partial [Thermodesulfobacteriota bacterium]